MRAPFFIACLASAAAAHAAEGMWLPSQAPLVAERMRADGFALDPAALADLSAAPMNAIVSLGGCSASFVSPAGLVATNHHCITATLQQNSTPERDLLVNGFLAATRADEVPAAPTVRVLVMEEQRDVTDDVTAGLTSRITGAARQDRIDARRRALIARCEATPGRRCDVRPLFGGARWQLQRMLEIRDVRLAYAPAGAVGNFGGEIDNWQWPRHTGDFAFYRAYVGPDGNPAAPSPANIPYRPKGHLTLASDDLKEGDFVLIAGYPGTTERYRTAAETRAWYGELYPLQLRLLTEQSELITREARTPAERIATAGALRRADNFRKKIAGQIEVASRVDLVAIKDASERALGEWAARPANRRTHGLAIANYDALIAAELAAARARLVNQTLDRALLLRAARDLVRFAHERQRPDAERALGFQERDRQALVDRLSLVERQYVPRIDRLMLEAALAEVARLPEAQRNLALQAAIAERGLDRLYAETRLGSRAELLSWVDRSVEEMAASGDPFLEVALAAHAADMASEARSRERAGRFQLAQTQWLAAVSAHAQSTGNLLYPDANGSLRFTWGRVAGRPLADGIAWTAFTTPAGILQKHSGTPPFDTPPALLDQLRRGAWGPYASPALGTLPINFLSTTDITNGNSGSAVLNARGELVGLAFDGTLEGMLSDWHFDGGITRTISVDARYMLWLMENVDNAGHLVAEMRGR